MHAGDMTRNAGSFTGILVQQVPTEVDCGCGDQDISGTEGSRASIACLCDIHVVLSLSQAIGEFCSHACSADGLYCEGGVPQLRAIVALHLHAILGHPQEIMQPGNVPAMVETLMS